MGRFAHITLGKAGSQWVKDVLTDPEIFAAQDLRFVQPTGAYSMPSFAAEPDRTLVAPAFHVSHEEWRAFSGPDDRCVVVLRDPRDSIVSWAFSVAYSHVTEPHISVIRPPMLALNLRGKLEVSMYVYWEAGDVQRSWSRLEPTANVRVYRYEDLVENEHATFSSMIEHFGWRVHGPALDAVVDRLTFAKRTGGRQRGAKDTYSHLRNGVPGDWKNYFDRDLAERFERGMPGLLTQLGYETSDDWWKEQPESVEALRDDTPDGETELESVRRELARTRAALIVAEGNTNRLVATVEGLRGVERELDRAIRRLGPEAVR